MSVYGLIIYVASFPALAFTKPRRPGTSVRLEGRNEFSKHDGHSQSSAGRLIVIKRPHLIIKAFLIKL